MHESLFFLQLESVLEDAVANGFNTVLKISRSQYRSEVTVLGNCIFTLNFPAQGVAAICMVFDCFCLGLATTASAFYSRGRPFVEGLVCSDY